MAFMEPQTFHGAAYLVETSAGTECVPESLVGAIGTGESALAALREYCGGRPVHPASVTRAEGFYARLSAPGYMDCTDWNGPFDTEAEALTYLSDTYGDDDEESEADDE